MARFAVVTLLAVLVMAVLADGAPQQQEPSPAGKAPFSFGPTYDEIVVETQLAVRPKPASAGLSLRSGRAKAAKAVYFRPNATASASGVEVRRITPLAAATTTTTTPSDGISFAARVVSDVNPLAVERARKAAAAARARRQSGSHSSFSSSSSFRSSSSSGHSEHSGPSGSSAAPGSTSYSSGTSSRSYTRLGDGHSLTVSETDDFQSSLGPANKAPVASRLHTVLVSSQ